MKPRKEIKVGTIVEVIANTGDAKDDNMIGQFAKVTEMHVHEGRLFCFLDKFPKDKVWFSQDEIEAVDFSKFFEMKRLERQIKKEVEQDN